MIANRQQGADTSGSGRVRPGDKTRTPAGTWGTSSRPSRTWRSFNACVHLICEDERIGAGQVTLTDALSPSARQDCPH
jgi:hypothetical protein